MSGGERKSRSLAARTPLGMTNLLVGDDGIGDGGKR